MADLNIEDLYRAAERKRLTAFETAQAESQRRLQSNLQGINTSYRNSVTQAQTASRISALGQEEKLAAAGLNQGGAYASPTSGYAETSRIAATNTLRSNLNNLSTARMQQEQSARDTASSEIAQSRENYENSVSDIRMQLAQAQINQYNTDRQYNYQVQTNAYQQAMQRWETYGIVLPADASILGVAAGTRTSTSAYNDAKLALSKAYNDERLALQRDQLAINRSKLALDRDRLAFDRWKALL